MRPVRNAPRRRRPIRALAALAAAVVVPLVLPAGTAHAEAPQTLVGELVRAWPDEVLADPDDDGHAAGDHTAAGNHAEEPLTWVETPDGETVRVPTEAVESVPVGSTVAVTVGAEPAEEPGVDGLEPARTLLSAEVLRAAPAADAARTASLTNQVTVVRVVPAGGLEDGTTLASVVAAVDGPVAGYWAEQTDGAVRFGVTAATEEWVHTTAGCSSPGALWNEVAGTVGFQPGPGRHLLVYLSSRPQGLSGCSYALGEVGSGIGDGGRTYVREVLPSVIAHELGHNLGLGHSSARQCDGATDDGSCRTAAYRDYYDVMGASWTQIGSLNAPQAAALGVLPAVARFEVPAGAASTTVTLAPLGSRSGTRAVQVTDPEGVTYWLEYRTATGRDAWLGSAANRFGLQTGVLLRRAGAMPDTSLLLDGTPATARGWDADLQAGLAVGGPVQVSGGDLTVTVDAVTAAGATVTVAGTATTAGPAAPRPGAPSVLPGAPAPEPEVAPAASAAAPPAPAPVLDTESPAAVQLGESTAVAPAGPGQPAPARSGPTSLVTVARVTTDGGLPAAPLAALGGGALVLLGWTAARLRARRRR